MTKLNRKQREALYRLYRREPLDVTYRQFRRTVVQGFDCAMIEWRGMWVGIELDGYTHT